jgi:signal transduction histidine kinase
MIPEREVPHKPKILIVEDERITAHDLRRVLIRLGYQVAGVAVSGASALDLIEQTRPDLLLADIGLEGEMDGIEVATRARETWKTPTVFLTAYSDPETMRRARVTEPYGYLVKPFAEQELNATIEIALQQKSIAADREMQVQTTAQILGRTQEELSAVASRLLSAQEQERERIARDLHDDLSQRVALLQMNIESISRKLPATIRETVRAEFDSALRRVSELSRELRELSHRLHPQILDDLGLERALRELCETFEERHFITVRFSTRNVPAQIPVPIAIALYRIVQESLQNIKKHAAATAVHIALFGGATNIEMSIRDDGTGFDPQTRRNGTGLGLISMAQRAKLIGGVFEIKSNLNRGTRIHVSVPLQVYKGQNASAAAGGSDDRG